MNADSSRLLNAVLAPLIVLLFLPVVDARESNREGISLSLGFRVTDQNDHFREKLGDTDVTAKQFDSYAIRAAAILHHREQVRVRLSGQTRARGARGAALMGGSIAPLGAYFVTIEIGEPPQMVNVDVDTGSSVLAVPGIECTKQCDVKGLHVYAANESTTASSTQCSDPVCKLCREDKRGCSFRTLYGDGSFFDGYVVKDRVRLGSLAANVTFGVATSLAPPPEVPIDGLIGFAYEEMACMPTCTKPLLDGLLKRGSISRDMFSICLDRNDGGVLTLGGIDQTVVSNQLTVHWVQMNDTTPKTFYTVPLIKRGVRFGKETLELPSDVRYGIVDSGTTLLLMPEIVFKQIQRSVSSNRTLCSGRAAVKGLCGSSSWFQAFACVYGLTRDDIERLPTLEFDLGKKNDREWTMEIPASTYMLPVSTFAMNGTFVRPRDEIKPDADGTVGYCVGLFPMFNEAWAGIGVIFGDTIMANKYITIYDRENHRMGFADMGGNSCATQNAKGAQSRRVSTRWHLVVVGVGALVLLLVLSAAWWAIRICMRSERRAGYRIVQSSS